MTININITSLTQRVTVALSAPLRFALQHLRPLSRLQAAHRCQLTRGLLARRAGQARIAATPMGRLSAHDGAARTRAGWLRRLASLLLLPLLLGTLATGTQAVTCQNNLPPSNPDADYTVDAANGVVSDSRTGLMWKRVAEPAGMTWAAALTYAEAHSFAGFSDWRLPNIKELQSLVEECRINPSINDTVFPGTSGSYVWSGSPDANNSSYAWSVYFNLGYASNDFSRGFSFSVRLVRGGQSFGNLASVFQISGIGTLDTLSVFTVTGANLTAGMGFVTQDCTPANLEVVDASSSATQRKFQCTPRGSPGVKTATVRSAPSGTILKSALVNVTPVDVATLPNRFVFDTTIGGQVMGTPFPVQISARNAFNGLLPTFNGTVRLADDFGKTLSQSSITFVNGLFNGNISVLAAGGAQLGVTYTLPDSKFATGKSDQFDVIGLSQRPYSLEVKTGVVSATVTLSQRGATYATGTTNLGGASAFAAVPKGTYRVAVSKSGWSQTSYVAQDIAIDKDFTLNVDMKAAGKRPVLIVPGVMGSTLRAGTYANNDVATPRNFGDHVVGASPKLPKRQCDASSACTLADDLEIYDPTVGKVFGAEQGHSDLTAMGSALLVGKLSPQFAVFPAPWDWRHNFEEAWKIYLKPKIDAAKAATGYQKVDVVAHSMGGLVTRAYIQDATYAGDIDRFIMIGTPNQGSTNAYYLMEGGQALELDSRVNSLGQNGYADVAFYAGAANELYRTYNGTEIYTLSSDNDVQNDSDYVSGQNAGRVMIFLNRVAPGGRDLLPTYDFLRRWTATLSRTNTADYNNGTPTPTPTLNPRVKALNESANVSRFKSIDTAVALQTTDVRTHIFVSNSEDTLFGLGYSATGDTNGQYPLGIPNYTSDKRKGDGTVPVSSAQASFLQSTVGAYKSHPYMLGGVRDDVLAKLTANRTFAAAQNMLAEDLPRAKLTAAATVPTLVVGLAVDAAVVPLVTAPGGAQAGTVTATGSIVAAIPGSDVDSQRHQNRINLKDPADGVFVLGLSAESTLLRTGPRVTIDYATPAAGSKQTSVRFIKPAGDFALSVAVDRAAARPVRIQDIVGVPTALKATRVSGNTQLNWTPASDANVIGYRVYSRLLSEAIFQLDGATAVGVTTFASSRTWATSDEDAREFVVVAYAASGTESLIRMGNAVLNQSAVAANFTSSAAANGRVVVATPLPYTVSFTDQSAATSPINAWAWDFNSDGVVDSTVQHPSFAFQSYGDYTVRLQVTTDDGTAQRSRPAFVSVVPCAPIALQASCGLDVNGDGRIDSTDGLLIVRRLLGFSGASLTNGVTSASCAALASTHTDIANFVDNQVASGYYNLDGVAAGGASATSSGMLIIRALQGLSGNAVTTGAIRNGAVRTTWSGVGQIRDYLNTNCGTNFAAP